jgi:hypothetical protein
LISQNLGMTLARISWSVTTLVCVVAAILLLTASFYGYAIVTAVLSLAAAINLL